MQQTCQFHQVATSLLKSVGCNLSSADLLQLIPASPWITTDHYRADQFSSDRRDADFPRGVHWWGTIKELTGLCSSSFTVVGYDLVFSHTKL